MSTVRVTADFSSAFRAFTEINQTAVKQAARRSIKRALKSVGKRASQEVRGRRLIQLSAKSLKTRFREFDNTRSKDIAGMTGKLWISGRTENLARFYAKRVRAGRSKLTGAPLYGVKVNILGQQRIEPGGFLYKQGKGKLVLARKTAKRYPLEKRKGPSPSWLIEKAGLLPVLETFARERYAVEFEHNLKFYVERAVERAQSKGTTVKK